MRRSPTTASAPPTIQFSEVQSIRKSDGVMHRHAETTCQGSVCFGLLARLLSAIVQGLNGFFALLERTARPLTPAPTQDHANRQGDVYRSDNIAASLESPLPPVTACWQLGSTFYSGLYLTENSRNFFHDPVHPLLGQCRPRAGVGGKHRPRRRKQWVSRRGRLWVKHIQSGPTEAA